MPYFNTTQGALIQVLAVGEQNITYNIPRNLSISYLTEEFRQNSFRMERDCDIKIPEYLEIELSPNINIENFKTICHRICLELEIGAQKILSIPLRFMLHLKNYELCDNKIYISIPFNLFINEMKLISLDLHSIRFVLTNIENHFTSCKLISKGIYYDSNIRRNMVLNNHEEIIQQLRSTEIIATNPKDEFLYKIPFDGIHKGFYIECENVDEVNEISLSLNENIRFIYNRFLIRTKCVKISQQLLYLPMNFDKTQHDRTSEGFEGSINLSRIDQSLLKIKFDNLHSRVCIYGLGSNILRHIGGMGGVAYNYSFTSHDIKDYQENGLYYVSNPIFSSASQNLTLQNPNSNVISNSNVIYKLITDNDKLSCCITYEDISVNARYMGCEECHNNFNEDSINQWFSQRPHRKTCPMCRVNWTDFNIYINGVEPEPSGEPVPIEVPEPVVYTQDDAYLEGQRLNPPAST